MNTEITVRSIVSEQTKDAAHQTWEATKAVTKEAVLLTAAGTVVAAEHTSKAACWIAAKAEDQSNRIATWILNRKK